jgi:hypothetical protein
MITLLAEEPLVVTRLAANAEEQAAEKGGLPPT